MADTDAAPSATANADSKRVRFRGSTYIEYDAEQAPVVRLAGAGRRGSDRGGVDSSSLNSDDETSKLLSRMQLECQARGIECGNAKDEPSPIGYVTALLQREYVRELRAALHVRGFAPPPAAASADSDEDEDVGSDLQTLETQLQLAELLLTQTVVVRARAESTLASSATGSEEGNGVDESVQPRLELSPQALERLQLAKKDLDGRVDEGYVFGRRFYSVETYVDTLEFDDLVAIAQDRSLAIPEIPESEKKAMKVVERDLCARYSTSGMGKPLKQLTLRELVVEARARGLIVKESRDSKGKRSKKGLIEKLRPVLREEVVEEKILEKRDDLLRILLREVLEREAMQHQREELLRLIQRYLKQEHPLRNAANLSENGTPEPMDVDGSTAAVVEVPGASTTSDQLVHCFALLTKAQIQRAMQN